MVSTSTMVYCERCKRDVPALYRDPRCPYCLQAVEMPITRKGQPWPWLKKTVLGSLAAAYATYHFYSVGGLEAALAVPVVIGLVYGLNELIERTGWWRSEPPATPPRSDGWLDEADASHRRGTSISTRYDSSRRWREASSRPGGGGR